jgi:branched-chain amino acid transport system ATP-binding protein
VTAALQAERLSRRFGGLLAVSDVSLELAVGELHAVIGPHGAGKSTVINLRAGELAPTAGSIRFEGLDVTGWCNWRIARCGVGR